FAEGADPDEQALRSYYDQNAAAFETPESAKVAYVALSAEAVEAQVRLSPDDVRAYYDQNQARYAVPEQRRASHLLIQVAPGASEDVRKAAREKAQSLLAEARGGAEFAALAREHSED